MFSPTLPIQKSIRVRQEMKRRLIWIRTRILPILSPIHLRDIEMKRIKNPDKGRKPPKGDPGVGKRKKKLKNE
jgi:hypothetical protein